MRREISRGSGWVWGRTVAALLAVLVGLAPAPARAQGAETATQWVRWEITQPLTSTAPSTNQDFYRNVKLRVAFERKVGGVVQEKFDSLAFWVGNKDLKFRAAFPTAGTWTWTSACEVGCTNTAEAGGLVKTGTVQVNAYTGSTALYKNGFLKIKAGTAADRGFLTFHNGTAFPWIGDTAWAGPINATSADWTSYLKTHAKSRQKMKYTVIQVAYPIDWMQTDGVQPNFPGSPNQKPFKVANCDNSGAIPRSTCQPDPAFWQEYDRRIQEANDAGFVVCLIGLMERILEDKPWPPSAESQHLARYVASRLAGNFVVYSPSFDRPKADQSTRINAVGAEAAAVSRSYATPTATPGKARQLIGLHLAASDASSDYLFFKSQPWLSFYLMQSGQALNLAYSAICGNQTACQCNTASGLNEKKVRDEQLRLVATRAIDMVTAIRAGDPAKPVVNAEAIYETNDLGPACKLCISRPCAKNPSCPACATQSGACDNRCPAQPYAEHYSPLRVRQTGYYSLFSGAAGYTAGAGGVVDWTGYVSGLNREATTTMKQLAGLMSNVPWSILRPAQDRLTGNSLSGAVWTRRVAMANAENLLVYSPNNSKFEVKTGNLAGWPNQWSKQWFNPRATTGTGFTDVAAQERNCASPTCSFQPQAAGDWVLVLKKVGSSQSQALGSLRAWATTAGEDEVPVVVTQFVDEEGVPVGDPVQVSDALDLAEKAEPRVVRDANDNYLVVWESAGGEEAARLSARRLDGHGNPLESAFTLGSSESASLGEASVVPLDPGGFAVAWVSRGEASQVFLRTIDGLGNLQSPVTVATAGPGNALANPELASDEKGAYVVVWQEMAPPSDSEADFIELASSVKLQRFDATGSAVGSEALVTLFPTEAPFEVGSVSLGNAGEVMVAWDSWDNAGGFDGVFARPIDSQGGVGEVLTVWVPEEESSSF